MNDPADRLYDLLPLVYRQRDAAQGYPLQALLRVIAEQANLIQDDIDRLYENWFIETAEDWVVPYIGELIGYRPVHEAGEPGAVTTPRELRRNAILIPRREVAETVHFRRRKGTLALLESLAMAAAGWPARAVEFYRLLGRTQPGNFAQSALGRTVDLRHVDALEQLDTPFDELAHRVDVRRPNSGRTPGRFNIPSVGLFVWRLRSYSVTETPARGLEQVGPHAFTFSALGNDAPLYNRPQPETEASSIAGELNLPTPIRRRRFEERVIEDGQERSDYYGPGKSLLIWAPDWPTKKAPQPIDVSRIIAADLTDWQYVAPRGAIAVDPELGRILFPAAQWPKAGVRVTYHYAFSADVGGGEYERPLSQPAGVVPILVSSRDELARQLTPWQDEDALDKQPVDAVIEITRSGVYAQPMRLQLKAGHSLQIRAASGARPIILLQDNIIDQPDALTITGQAGSRMTLDGLLIAGRSVQVLGPEKDPDANGTYPEEDLCRLIIRHSTLVPGWLLDEDCEPKRPNEPSLELLNTRTAVRIEHSILGSIQVTADQVAGDPIAIHISDSILDATGSDCGSPRCEALGAPGWPLAHAVLTVERSTVFGRIFTHAIELAENSIFMGQIRVGRRQRGCMRFCYVMPGSRTPRRYHCQPDLARETIAEQMRRAAEADVAAAQERETRRVRPQFNSNRYGRPDYCQLANACAVEIKRGADDESEMGVFHDLFQPQREANLRARLDEYTPAGTAAGIILAS
jgi:hypothetical protein